MSPATLAAFRDELEKLAFDWKKFREGVKDEALPLGGATAGAALGRGNPLRGAALGYAVGGGASLLANRLKPKDQRKPMSLGRKILGASAIGYGAGGLGHAAAAGATKNLAKGSKLKALFHGQAGWKKHLVEEGMPATGAVLGTGVAYGSHKGPIND